MPRLHLNRLEKDSKEIEKLKALQLRSFKWHARRRTNV